MQTAIKQRPILFSTAMIKAILEGRKTMTRRIIKSKHESGLFQVSTAQMDINLACYYHRKSIQSLDWDERTVDGGDILCPYGKIGDILWVRETFVRGCVDDGEGNVSEPKYWYRADNNCPDEWHNEKKGEPGNIPWKPSIFMPYKACRLFLRITDIRVERLQDISEADAIAEGIKSHPCYAIKPTPSIFFDYMQKNMLSANGLPVKLSFRSLWESINGVESWENNPFVWVVSFERIDKPE